MHTLYTFVKFFEKKINKVEEPINYRLFKTIGLITRCCITHKTYRIQFVPAGAPAGTPRIIR